MKSGCESIAVAIDPREFRWLAARFLLILPGFLLLLPLAAAPSGAQTLTAASGYGQQTSRTVSFDASLELSGKNVIAPGALNAVIIAPIQAVMEAQLSTTGADARSLTGSLRDVAELAPRQMVRNTAGPGFLQLRPATAAEVTSLALTTHVPAVTGLGFGQYAMNQISLTLPSLTVFP
jgi:hypothetical protein